MQNSNVPPKMSSSSRLKCNVIYIKLYCSFRLLFKLKRNISLNSSTNVHNLKLNMLKTCRSAADEIGLMDPSNYCHAVVSVALFFLANVQVDREGNN